MKNFLIPIVGLTLLVASPLTAQTPNPARGGNASRTPLKPSNTSRTEMNKRVMARFLDFINTADEAMASELVSSEAVFHVPGRPEPVRGPAGYLEIIAMMRGGFPDIQWTLEELIVEGDKVAARFTMRGTHKGVFFGIPPTGRKISVQAMNIYHLSQGKIVEEHGQPDLLSLMQQIGGDRK